MVVVRWSGLFWNGLYVFLVSITRKSRSDVISCFFLLSIFGVVGESLAVSRHCFIRMLS